MHPPGAATPERLPREASPAFSLMVQAPGLPRKEGQPPTHTVTRLSSREALLQAPLALPPQGVRPSAEHLLRPQVPPEEPRVLKVRAPCHSACIQVYDSTSPDPRRSIFTIFPRPVRTARGGGIKGT